MPTVSSTENDTSTKQKKNMKAQILSPLLLLLQRKPSFVIALSESISAHECDFLARILLKITEHGGYRMRLIKSLIRHELVKYQHMPQNIFRSNSLASKCIHHLFQLYTHSYMCVCVFR
jgi:hypothetical protein